MNFDQLEKIIAKNSSIKGLLTKQTNSSTQNGDLSILHNTSLNSLQNAQSEKVNETNQNLINTQNSPYQDQRTLTMKSTEKSFLTNDNISFNLQTTQQTQCGNNETVGLLKEQLTKIKLLTNDLQMKDHQIDILKEQVQELETEKTQLEQNFYDLQKQIRFNEDDFNIRLLSLQEKNESLLEFNHQLQQRIQIQNEQITQYQSDITQYRLAIEKYDIEKQNLISEVSQVKGVLKGIQQSTIGSREQMALLLSENENRGIELEKKRIQIEQLEQANDKSKGKIEKLEKKLASKEDKISEMEQQIQKVEKLTADNQKFSSENSQLRVDLSALKMRYEESMRSLEDTRASLARQIQSKSSLEENIDILQRDLQQSKKCQAEIKKRSEQLINDNLQLKEQLIELEQINRRMQRDSDLIIQEISEFAKDKLDEFEGDQALLQIKNQTSTLIQGNHSHNQSQNEVNSKGSYNMNQHQNYDDEECNEEDEEDQDDDNQTQNQTHNKSAQDTSISNSFSNQSRASIRGFQNAIISNRLASLDSFNKKEQKRSKSNTKPPKTTQKKQIITKRKKSNQNQVENVQSQQITSQNTPRQYIDLELLIPQEQLKIRIGYFAQMVGMYKKKVSILESQQQNLNSNIEKLQDHIEQLQQMTILNKAQQENTLFAVKEEYEEKIMRMKELFEQNEQEFQNKLYNCDDQIMSLQGEIEYLKHDQQQKEKEFIDVSQKYFEAEKINQNYYKLEQEVQNMENKIQLFTSVIEQFLYGFFNMHNKLQTRSMDVIVCKKFFEYFSTLNQVLNPFAEKHNISQAKQNNQQQQRKDQIYKLFRKGVFSVLFIVKIKKTNVKGDFSNAASGYWPNKTIKNSFLSKKTQQYDKLSEQIKRIIDKNCQKSSSSGFEKEALQSIGELLDKFNQTIPQYLFQNTQNNFQQKKENSLSLKAQKDANKISKLIKQNETFQIELNKMTQRVLALSEYTKQIESQFKDQENTVENKYKSQLQEKENTIQNLKHQLNLNQNINSLSQNSYNYSEHNLQQSVQTLNKIQSYQQFNSPAQSNLLSNQLIPPLPTSAQSFNQLQQQIQTQQYTQQQLQTSQTTEESRPLIKNQSSLIKKFYSQGNHNSLEQNLNQSQNYQQRDQFQQNFQTTNYENNLQNQNDFSNIEPSHSLIHQNHQNDHISVDSLQNELSKIMQRKNLRDSSNNSSASKLVKCPGKIVRNTNK
ncbi:hypothetical protein TTHERM_00237630 (macronuclear) [Tetrahymena thermophila SB210]|uniref:Uncharacterized protein n=1 Tax=Tetrahymena thermophila (strain SB210) TaxID=312017 RepID=I7MAG5_TETTS|nr:hypothetical protein TTHERM_00237630 [Tetrahymena thermophila SB210]EAS04548.4 hypothetical protein TTHERM_00237630 [Tetrahymena thermophila SB210]|eukprot:XP_001024793.4 hypothetical protein TTHERM_00237630 [Tetrahymena thermophila SB210]